MRARLVAVWVALVAGARAAAGQPHGPAPPAPAPADDPATTDVWREPDPPIEPVRAVLALPEALVEAAFIPVELAVTAIEQWRLDRRVYDFLRNDAGTIVVAPTLRLSAGDGFGGGAKLILSRLPYDGSASVGGNAKLDGDWRAGLDYGQRIARADGRELRVELGAEHDRNLRFFGVGGDTPRSDERVIRRDRQDARLGVDITPLGDEPMAARVELGWYRQKLGPGEDPSIPGLGEPGDMVVPPADFGRRMHHVRGAIELVIDTRDTLNRPERGVYGLISGSAVAAFGAGDSLGAIGAAAELTWYLSVLPDKRVLVLGGGASITGPARGNGSIPLDALTSLGVDSHLRGFDRGRFRDRHGWWALAEYRWPLWQYTGRAMALDAALFAEAGGVSGRLVDLVDTTVHVDGGGALSLGYDRAAFLRLQLGASTEGVEFVLAIGKEVPK